MFIPIGAILIIIASFLIVVAVTNPTPPTDAAVLGLRLPEYVVQEYEMLGAIIGVFGGIIVGFSGKLKKRVSILR